MIVDDTILPFINPDTVDDGHAGVDEWDADHALDDNTAFANFVRRATFCIPYDAKSKIVAPVL